MTKEQVEKLHYKPEFLKIAILVTIWWKSKDIRNIRNCNIILFKINIILKEKCCRYPELVFIFNSILPISTPNNNMLKGMYIMCLLCTELNLEKAYFKMKK